MGESCQYEGTEGTGFSVGVTSFGKPVRRRSAPSVLLLEEPRNFVPKVLRSVG